MTYAAAMLSLTLHSELLFDVLEVVRILCVDGTVGSLNRHFCVPR